MKSSNNDFLEYLISKCLLKKMQLFIIEACNLFALMLDSEYLHKGPHLVVRQSDPFLSQGDHSQTTTPIEVPDALHGHSLSTALENYILQV